MLYDVAIVGAGMAGLSCAKVVLEHGLKVTVLESSDRIGGRIRTDSVSGYNLDYGFQVLQTGYPTITDHLDLDKLELHSFPSGVAVRHRKKFHIIADPRQHPRHLFSTLASPPGTVTDRLRMLKLARFVCRGSLEDIFLQPEERTVDFLKAWGFSKDFITGFFVPFFAGACLDRSITASSRILKYIFRLFTTGGATLPSKGMAEIPKQLGSLIPPDLIQLNTKADKIGDGSLTLANKKVIHARHIVIATEEPVLGTILGKSEPIMRSIGETCLYYSAEWTPPFSEPFLVLNGENHGPINNMAFPSMIAPHYAPPGKTLISIVVLDDHFRARNDLEKLVRIQCRDWFGEEVRQWEHIHTYQIEHALPDQSPPTDNPYELPRPFSKHVSICGEHRSIPGLQWALMSGANTARSVVNILEQ